MQTPPQRPRLDYVPDDDDTVLRAVCAFLQDDDTPLPLDSGDDNASILQPSRKREDSSTANDNSADFDIYVSDHHTPSQPITIPSPIVLTTTARKPALPKKVNHSRLRMRNDILSLQQKAIALERRLAEIENASSGTAVVTSARETTLSQAWQTIAESQREYREAAEHERDELRTRLANYKGAIKRVRRYVAKRARQQSAFPQLVFPPMIRPSTLDLDTIGGGFQEISNHLQTMYAQLDSVFPTDRLPIDRLTDSLHDFRIQNEDTSSMSFEFLESRVVPFDLATTAEAVWYYYQFKHSGIGVSGHELADDSDDLLRRKLSSTLAFPNFDGRIQGQLETRRIVEDNRVIILQCGVYTRLYRSKGVDGAATGFGYRVLNWTVITPPRSETLRTAASPTSHVNIFKIVLPFFPLDGNTTVQRTPNERREFKAFVVEACQFVHTYERQAVENILLDRSVHNATY